MDNASITARTDKPEADDTDLLRLNSLELLQNTSAPNSRYLHRMVVDTG